MWNPYFVPHMKCNYTHQTEMKAVIILTFLALAHASKLPETYVSDDDIINISEELYRRDDNRMGSSDFKVNPDGPRFITDVNTGKLRQGTYALLAALFPNFEPEIGVEEEDCPSCRGQERDFLTAVVRSRPGQRLWEFLADRDLASGNEQGFRDQLYNYWFTRYSRSRGAAIDSCGFEHVFAGELKGTSASGFHNWVQFYQQEENGDLEYSSYIKGCEPNLHVTRFYWFGRFKRIGSLFVGTSPEYELSLYTLCFLTRPNRKCTISANGNERTITTYRFDNAPTTTVGTAYPDC